MRHIIRWSYECSLIKATFNMKQIASHAVISEPSQLHPQKSSHLQSNPTVPFCFIIQDISKWYLCPMVSNRLQNIQLFAHKNMSFNDAQHLSLKDKICLWTCDDPSSFWLSNWNPSASSTTLCGVDRIRSVGVRNNSVNTLSTSAPQGCLLSALITHNWVATSCT